VAGGAGSRRLLVEQGLLDGICVDGLLATVGGGEQRSEGEVLGEPRNAAAVLEKEGDSVGLEEIGLGAGGAHDGVREAGEKGLAADREGRKEVTLDGFAGHPASVRRADGQGKTVHAKDTRDPATQMGAGAGVPGRSQ